MQYYYTCTVVWFLALLGILIAGDEYVEGLRLGDIWSEGVI